MPNNGCIKALICNYILTFYMYVISYICQAMPIPLTMNWNDSILFDVLFVKKNQLLLFMIQANPVLHSLKKKT